MTAQAMPRPRSVPLPRSERDCGHCGARFVPVRAHQKYCCDRCSRAGWQKEKNAKERERVIEDYIDLMNQALRARGLEEYSHE